MKGALKKVGGGGDVITISDVKLSSRIDQADEDARLAALIKSAHSMIEGKHGIGRALLTQTWDLFADRFPSRSDEPICIPLAPLQTVTYVKYVDASGVEQTLSTALYTVDIASEPGRIGLLSGQVWPATSCQINAVTVRFIAGFGDAPSDVDQPLIEAMLMAIEDAYMQRGSLIIGSSLERWDQIEEVINRYRIPWFA